jgi:hypothetical protein
MINEDDEQLIRKLWLTMTEDELRDLHEHLAVLFEDDPVLRPWHSHFGDDSSVKLSISLE